MCVCVCNHIHCVIIFVVFRIFFIYVFCNLYVLYLHNTCFYSTVMQLTSLEHLVNFGMTKTWNQDIVPSDDSIKLIAMNSMREIPSTQPAKTHTCKKCGRSYAQKQGLFNHVKWKCGKEPQFFCNICSYKTHHKASLNRHILGVHKLM